MQLLLLCIVVGLLVKMRALPFIVDDWFVPRYVLVIVISGLMLYFFIAADAVHRAVLIAVVVLLCCSIYVVFLPGPFVDSAADSQSVVMALIHFPLFSLSLLGISFMGDNWCLTDYRLAFVGYLGESVVDK